MAVAKKATAAKKAVAKKRAPRSAAQIHKTRVTDKRVEAALNAGADEEITDVSAWKQRNDRGGRKLKLPSGFVCLARNPGMMWFVEQGLVPNSLLDFIMKAIEGDKPKEVAKDVKKMIGDGQLATMMEFANLVCVHSVLKPKVHALPEDPEDRSEDLLYVDEVDLDDKMFIFNWVVGGTADLDRFHEEQGAAVQNLRDS